MQANPGYADVVRGGRPQRAHRAGGRAGRDARPGIGFGKNVSHNLSLIAGLEALTAGERPVLVGASRKGSIGAISGEADPQRRLPGTLVLHLRAAAAGAAMLRVHDVPEHSQALKVWAALQRAERQA